MNRTNISILFFLPISASFLISQNASALGSAEQTQPAAIQSVLNQSLRFKSALLSISQDVSYLVPQGSFPVKMSDELQAKLTSTREYYVFREAKIQQLLQERADFLALFPRGGDVGLRVFAYTELESSIRRGQSELESLKKQWRLPTAVVDRPTKYPPYDAENMQALISHAKITEYAPVLPGAKPLTEITTYDGLNENPVTFKISIVVTEQTKLNPSFILEVSEGHENRTTDQDRTVYDGATFLVPAVCKEFHAYRTIFGLKVPGRQPLERVLNCDLAANFGRISLEGPF